MKYIIEDWMGQHVYGDKTFDTFEDARAFIDEIATQEATTSLGFDESIYQGVCEDLYAEEVTE